MSPLKSLSGPLKSGLFFEPPFSDPLLRGGDLGAFAGGQSYGTPALRAVVLVPFVVSAPEGEEAQQQNNTARVESRARRFVFVPPSLFGSLTVPQSSAKCANGWTTAVHIRTSEPFPRGSNLSPPRRDITH